MKRSRLVQLSCFALIAAPAIAQTPQAQSDLKALSDIQARMNGPVNTALPPVASLTCEQMLVELGAAGAKMSGQIDPSFATNALALQKQVQSGVAAPVTQAEAAKNQARVNQLGAQVAGSMQGIDVQRMMALSTAFDEKNCKTPQ